MTTAETYVTAAYLVFLGVVLLYVVIYSFRIAHLERALADLTQESAPAYAADEAEPQPEPAVAT